MVEKSKTPGGRRPLSKNEQKRRQVWIDQAEAAILELEEEKEKAIAEMVDPGLGNDRRLVLGRRISEIENELEKHLAHWEEWSLEIEEGIE